LEIYRFFRDEMGVRFIQFIPIVERTTETLLPLANLGWSTSRKEKRPLYVQAGNRVTDRTVDPDAFGRFLVSVFNEWLDHDVGEVYVQHFDVALANWHGEPPGLCIFSETCGLALALEHNGDLYSCDHYVEPDYLLGNITETPMIELIASERQQAFGAAKRETLPQFCIDCEVRFACHAVRLSWGLSPKPFHHHPGRRRGPQLPMRRLQDLLQPHRPRDAAHVQSPPPGAGPVGGLADPR